MVKQEGIHAGQKAHTYRKIYHQNTGKTEYQRDLNGDFFKKQVGNMTSVSWEMH
ncbi:hypothetical protein ACQKM9_03365 [Viridibacillus sp. NPDC093762]|uniref:hypothetical protein n=1 Tax=Viridibacillus sp. NPDC093762 TaxID=3390720 RepID=UPI003D030A20